MNASILRCPEGVAPVNHWGNILGKCWGFGGAPLDRPCLLGLRGWRMNDDETHDVVAKPAYDDTGVLFVPGAEPFVFPYASHPYQTHSRLSDDADGDGVGDVACIRPGTYLLTLALTKPHPVWIFSTLSGGSRIPCARDLNHDGKIDWREETKQLTASAILLHTGFDAPAGAEHRSSIGCSTAPLSTLEVIARAGKTLEHRLILATEAIGLLEGERDTDPAPPENQA